MTKEQLLIKLQELLARINTRLIDPRVADIFRDEEMILSKEQCRLIYAFILEPSNQQTILDIADSTGIIFRVKDFGRDRLPRTIAIVVNFENDCELIVITGNKLADLSKDHSIGTLGMGRVKDVKLGVRVDLDRYEFRAIFKVPLTSDISALQTQYQIFYNTEIAPIIRHRKSEYINPIYLGVVYKHRVRTMINDYEQLQKVRGIDIEADQSLADSEQSDFYSTLAFSPCADGDLMSLPALINDTERDEIVAELEAKRIPALFKDLMLDILSGLADIHAKGDVHRDIKGANILLFRRERLHAKITDFGQAANIARHQPEPLGSIEYACAEVFAHHLLDSDYVSGLRSYYDDRRHFAIARDLLMSVPNICEGSNINLADPRDDIYAAGIVFYTMITGNSPRSRQEFNQVIKDFPDLKILLGANRERRPSASEAIATLQASGNRLSV